MGTLDALFKVKYMIWDRKPKVQHNISLTPFLKETTIDNCLPKND